MNRLKKELKEWGIFLGVLGLLYFSGLHTEVAGFVQRMVLSTGLIQAESIQIGDQKNASYDFLLEDQNGNKISLEQLKGKTIFLNFWATWCPPCIAEMPDIHDLYLKIKDEQVAFVLIAQDEDFETAKKFIQKKGYTFPIYRALSARPIEYAGRSIPSTFVISRQGKIIAKHTGMAKYDTEEFIKLMLDN